MTIWPDTALVRLAEQVARTLYTDTLSSLQVTDEVTDEQWAELMADPRRRDIWLERGLDLVDMVQRGMTPPADHTHPDRLWSLVDWSLYGWGVGDQLRERAADTLIANLPAADAEHIRFLMGEWEKRHGHRGRDAYDGLKALHGKVRERLASTDDRAVQDALDWVLQRLDEVLGSESAAASEAGVR